MIHFTLLPNEKMKALKTDYRIRIVIILAFFISLSILIGILSLAPSYIISFSQEKEFVGKIEKIQKTRDSDGTNSIIKDLNSSYSIIKKLKSDKTNSSFLANVERILNSRTKNISLISFESLNTSREATTTKFMIQGRALDRESLVSFKKKIESDQNISKIELPISDLAKSKDISFSMKFEIKK